MARRVHGSCLQDSILLTGRSELSFQLIALNHPTLRVRQVVKKKAKYIVMRDHGIFGVHLGRAHIDVDMKR